MSGEKDFESVLGRSSCEVVKYHFVDMQGNLREKTRSRDEITGRGITSVDGSSIFGKIIPPTESDMLLVPDMETLQSIPWKDRVLRVMCDVYYPSEKEGEEPNPFFGCSRSILSRIDSIVPKIVRLKAEEMFKGKPISKYHSHFSPELEFILLDESYDVNKLHLDSNLKNDNYFVPPSEKVDKALMAMMKNLTLMGLKREIYHTEVTSYQCEIGISFGNVSRMADGVVTAKYIISQTAQAHGLRASFIPKFREGVNGSGMHVHQNLAATLLNGTKPENLFFDISRPDGLSRIGENYIAGLLKYAREITAITNPLPISYKRLVPGAEAPTYIAWDWQNRTALARGHSRGTKAIRVEYRSPDPKCNPYLAFAAMLAAGLSGIEQDLKSDPADKRDFYHDNKGVKELPGNLGEALKEMQQSEMLRNKLGNEIVDALYNVGSNEWQKNCRAITDFDIIHYI